MLSCCRVAGSKSLDMSAASRVGSAGRRQADRELWALRDNVLRLEEELRVSRAQLDRVTRQYNCLIQLLHKYVCFSVYLSVSLSVCLCVSRLSKLESAYSWSCECELICLKCSLLLPYLRR